MKKSQKSSKINASESFSAMVFNPAHAAGQAAGILLFYDSEKFLKWD